MIVLKKINLLEKKQEKYKKVKSLKESILMIKIIIDDCINLGAIPFAQAARHAFIAKSILNSLQNKKIIKKQKLKNFESSINTITTEFLRDINLVYLKKNFKKFFFYKYGHLRPGTYNILSKNYNQMQNFEFQKQSLKVIKNNSKNIFSFSEESKIKKLLKKNFSNEISFKQLIEYIRKSIYYREYSKFVFTKNVDLIFQILNQIGKLKNIKKKI